MPSSRTPTPQEFFGYGAVPLSSYFDGPAGGSTDRRFAPEARGLLQQQEEYDQEQISREADRIARQLLDEAPNLSDQQIQEQLLQNPRVFGSQELNPLNNYMRFRQVTVPASQADEVLGPQFLQDIKDPRHRELFQHRMLNEGYSANDAWDEYQRDEHNDKFAMQLAELGATDAELEALKSPSGLIDPVKAARLSAAKKAAQKKTTGVSSTLDVEIEFLKDRLEERAKRLETLGGDITKDAEYVNIAASLDKAYAEKANQLRPPASTTSAAPVGVKSITVDPEADTLNLTPEEEAEKQQQKVAAQGADDEIARAWTEQKLKLTDEITEHYKTPKELRQIANAIVQGKMHDSGKVDSDGKPIPMLYRWYVLQKLGKKPDDVIFSEPQNKRWGTQKVTADELLKAWAESFLKADNDIQSGAGGNIKAIEEIK